MKIAVFKNVAIFTGKLQACNFIKKGALHRCFPLNIAKILRTPISKNIRNFSLNQQFCFFWTKFSQKGCFRSKTEKLNSAIEFCIFELAEFPNFSLDLLREFFFKSMMQHTFELLFRDLFSEVYLETRTKLLQRH